MKKSLFGLLASVLFVGTVALSVTSCIDGKDDGKKDTMEALCHVSVSEDVLKVADITVHYLDSNGQEATERMTTTEWKKTWTTTTLPAKVGVWAQMTPKLVLGETKDTYQLKSVTSVGYLFHSAKGKDWGDGWTSIDPNTAPENVAAANVQSWCSKGATVGCEIDAKGMGQPAKVDFGGNDEGEGDLPPYSEFCVWVLSLFGLGPEHCI